MKYGTSKATEIKWGRIEEALTQTIQVRRKLYYNYKKDKHLFFQKNFLKK